MQKLVFPSNEKWQQACLRPEIVKKKINNTVNSVLREVKKNRDKALFQFTLEFDGVKLDQLKVTEIEIKAAIDSISFELKNAIEIARRNIEKFHKAQSYNEPEVETIAGVKCWRKNVPIDKVGIYIPGGTAPLFSTILMLGIPAKIAGCKEIIMCSPPDKNGRIHPAILFTASILGITNIYKVGGAQAIAAMAYGTETIPQVYKIFGPGNQYVTKAKELIQQEGISIDMPAGPSEVLIIADHTSYPEFLAADLLSQAEHGSDSQVILVSNNESVIDATLLELNKQIIFLPRKEIAKEALKNSKAIVLKNNIECFEFSNQYAPEHLIISIDNASEYVNLITNAGSVFLGHYSCESAGDYASGTNHTLPTNGYAKNYSGVSLDSFVKKITFQELNKEGIKNIGEAIEIMADAEELFAHKNAVTIRLKFTEMIKLKNLVRQNILSLKPYSSARDEFSGKQGIFLDANENPFGEWNRYPDPLQKELKEILAKLRKMPIDNIFIGNGSDEIIDLAFRIFCTPGKDKALTITPSYGMYDVSAATNDIELLKIPLKDNFQLDLEKVISHFSENNLKLVILCSPNNPTGNSLDRNDIKQILMNFNGIVLIDEAYIDFSKNVSWIKTLKNYPNLIVCQTLSKAYGLAAARVGIAYANREVIQFFNKVKPPYNVSKLNQKAAIQALKNSTVFEKNKEIILTEKDKLINNLKQLQLVKQVYPSDSNFVLVEVEDANEVYEKLINQNVIVRNRSNEIRNCIRITVGSPEENIILINAMKNIKI